MVYLWFVLLMKMDGNLNVNSNHAGGADLDEVKTNGASSETAKQDGLTCSGQYIFLGGESQTSTSYREI